MTSSRLTHQLPISSGARHGSTWMAATLSASQWGIHVPSTSRSIRSSSCRDTDTAAVTGKRSSAVIRSVSAFPSCSSTLFQVPSTRDMEQFPVDSDDVGTAYDSSTGGLGPFGGSRWIHPAPPSRAASLTLSIGTPSHSPDGELLGSRPVKQLLVDLRTGQVVPDENR